MYRDFFPQHQIWHLNFGKMYWKINVNFNKGDQWFYTLVAL